MVDIDTDPHVLIVGGGIVGLSLAHALKKLGIKATVFERDPKIGLRSQGWAVSLRYGLPLLQEYLAPDIAHRLATECNVDPEIPFVQDGQLNLLDGRDLSVKFARQMTGRLVRTSRPKLRALLAESLAMDVQWGKRFVSYEITSTGLGVVATFEDGSTARGSLLVSCEGAVSRVRSTLLAASECTTLPICAAAAVQTITRPEMDVLRAIDPLMFMSVNPETNVFFWCSTQAYLPNLKDGEDRYEVLNYVSWPSEDAAAGSTSASDDPEEILEDLKRHVEGFDPLLRDMIARTKPDAPITRIPVRDWIPVPYNTRGRVCLAGDAAGCLTIYRGEGVNHGILDALLLAEAIRSIHRDGADAESTLDAYTQEITDRRGVFTPLSRQACLDAHDSANLTPGSPLLDMGQPPPESLGRLFKILAERKEKEGENKEAEED